MQTDYTLYGAELSLYSGKARAYLRYKGVDWQECYATLDVYQNTIIPKVGAPIIPVLQSADGEFIQDTTDIIDYLEARHLQSSVYPTTPKQKLVALLLEFFGDEWLTMPAMHYRWNFLNEQREFILSEFGNFGVPEGTLEEKIAFGEKLSAPFQGAVTKMGVTEQTIEGVEASYQALLGQLNVHFAQYNFLLGSRPSIGDFGFMGPLYAHLARDPFPKAMMQNQAPEVYHWVERMNAPVPLSGEFLSDDHIPVTLLPILKTQCTEQLPDVLDVIQHTKTWFEENPGGDLPRFLGQHSFTIGGKSGQRWISSYTQWMFQRPLFFYQSLSDDERRAVDELLTEIGGYDAFQTIIDKPVTRKAGQLELVEQS